MLNHGVLSLKHVSIVLGILRPCIYLIAIYVVILKGRMYMVVMLCISSLYFVVKHCVCIESSSERVVM